LQLEGDIVENVRFLSDLIMVMFQDDLLRMGSIVGVTVTKGGIPR